ncbi:MAG TPA: alkaline phosphatase family protein [Thermoanaerobaculia bacterium]|jgi:predicted AlkP superfamily phosphohydrolase/phosphomutase|nr:alkaline phosphatase family protein [Thermoanaerobaculia bacterium]
MRRIALPLFLLFVFPLAAHAAQQKVIVLGFDGVDARYTEQWMNEGKLPNLAKLRDAGTFRPLLPTTPAQTPVSWSTFSTGIDPGRTGIFDFLRRDPKTYLPVFAAFDETKEPFLFGTKNAPYAAVAVLLILALIALFIFRASRIGGAVAFVVAIGAAVGAFIAVQKLIPVTRPGVINRRQGIPFWEAAAHAGKKVMVVHVPVTFPANDFGEGDHLLSGLGVPDMSGRVGKPFYFTSELEFHRGNESGGGNEFSIEVVQLEDNKGVIHTKINGPPNKLFGDPPVIAAPMTITVANDRNSIQIEVSDQKFTLKPGEWSGWVSFEFPFNQLVKVHGISRFHLISSQPEVKLYLSPINFDPRSLPPGFKISSPTRWAPDLAKQYGLFKTLGWQVDTWAISEGFATEQMFWDDMEFTVTQNRKMYDAFLQSDNDLMVQYFEFPDRVGHVFWRAIDPKHPAYTPQLAEHWGNSLLRAYQLMDSIVGDTMKAADQQHATLLVVSDHGFASFRKAVNYDTWLVINGYLVLKTGVRVKERNLEMLFSQGQFWENVDWSKTRAYAMGLGEVYINLKGRESQGIVQPGPEYDALKAELKQRLTQFTDPETGDKVVRRVLAREEVYKSFDPNMIPDLFVTNNDGYRVSWQTALGGIPKDLLEPNKQVWSGDHCSVDPEIVKGIFFYNRKLTGPRAPYIADIYPTVLGLLGVKAPYELDGVELK